MSSPYVNTIPREREPWFPGDEHIERRIRAFIRWNAAMMVVKANKHADGIGGHLSTFASSASLYEIGFNHFFRGKDDGNAGDQVYFQGHAAPGVYARAFLEGRLTADDLDHFRTEIGRGGRGLSSYPHPRLMPDFWEFPTVSMGLGPISALYQARFNRYLLNREIADTSQSRVWCFLGDGECDEPETLGAISLASREHLDNLIFVINCNLQRLDGPVRGNGKIIQELEAVFRGAGWNVIKVIWGSKWDELLAQDKDGVLLNQMNTTVDGQFQRYSVESGEYIRDNFFGPDPRLRQMVAHLSDDELRNLPRGGHDYRKLYAAYKAAVENIGTGRADRDPRQDDQGLDARRGLRGPQRDAPDQEDDQGPARRPARPAVHAGRDPRRLDRGRRSAVLPPRRGLDRVPVHDGAPQGARRARSPSAPRRPASRSPWPATTRSPSCAAARASRRRAPRWASPACCATSPATRTWAPGSCRSCPTRRARSAWTRCSASSRSTPRRARSTSPSTTTCCSPTPRASRARSSRRASPRPGSMSSFIAAGTSYATHGVPMVPFYTFYSMFGFQRVGDLIWQAADQRTRGFLLGATAGRTTLLGEGLQHQDGHSLLLASTVPACQAYDPAFAYEVATIVQAGLQRMYGADAPDAERDVFYYLALYNENYAMPPMPDFPDIADEIVKGLYRWAEAPDGGGQRATILFSGSAQGAARAAAERLAADYGVAAELWSATSYKRLREDALEVERWNRLHPADEPRTAHVTDALGHSTGPIVAVTDFMKIVPEQIARFLPGRTFLPLGTDGMGRSDTREALRRHFEVDEGHVVVGVLAALAAEGVDRAVPGRRRDRQVRHRPRGRRPHLRLTPARVFA